MRLFSLFLVLLIFGCSQSSKKIEENINLTKDAVSYVVGIQNVISYSNVTYKKSNISDFGVVGFLKGQWSVCGEVNYKKNGKELGYKKFYFLYFHKPHIEDASDSESINKLEKDFIYSMCKN